MVVVSLVLTVCAKHFRAALRESSWTLSGISNVCPYPVRMSYLIRLSMLLMYAEKRKSCSSITIQHLPQRSQTFIASKLGGKVAYLEKSCGTEDEGSLIIWVGIGYAPRWIGLASCFA